MKFNEAEEKFRGLKARFAAGNLTEADFKAQLEELMVEDEGGTWWMLGYETERWYRYDGTSWVQADPPGTLPAEPAPAAEPALIPAAAEAADVHAARTPAPARRTSPAVFGVAALIVLVVGGFFVLRSFVAKPAAPTSMPTAGAVQPVAVKPSDTSTPEPTTEPSPTPTLETLFQVSASASQIVMYAGPDLKYGQVESYPRGTEFTVLARDTDAHWLLATAPDGNQGWLYFEWVAAGFGLSLVPTASVMPPPPPTATRKPRQSPKPTACVIGCG